MDSAIRRSRFGLHACLTLFALTAAAFVTAADLAAQAEATTGVIRGIVVDPTGNGVPGAAVQISHRETGLSVTVLTTSSGRFVRTLLPLGTYDVTATALGQFGDESVQGLVLRVGETIDLRLEFKPVALAEITVSGERAPLVDPEDVTSSVRLSEEVVDNLPNNGRNFLDLTRLTPGVQVSQGPDGDELNISGQRGIFNNVIVDGADFNNPFFGEQRGGQRPAFTFNQDAVEEVVVVAQGATAEFGRSAGGFVNVITKSGTNEFDGSVHYFGQWDGISAEFPDERGGGKPDFGRSQFGFTLGGPIVRDRAFFFVAYDQQEMTETKQQNRVVANQANLDALDSFLQTQWPGLFENEFGPIERTDDNKALIAKLDFNLSEDHQASVKYNYTWSQQVNGTFDVDSWGLSANGVEEDYSHAVNASLRSQLSNTLSNEFRIQYAREDRPRAYDGPILVGSDAPGVPQFEGDAGGPFPDVAMDFADGFRVGLPFFLPIDPGYDTRLQLVDNLTVLMGDHLFKAGVEFNRTGVEQQFIGFSNGRYIFDSVDGFMNFVTQGNEYVTCSDGSSSNVGVCPPGTTITGPVLLYLQSATVPGVPEDQLGLQDFSVTELGLFIQDTWKPASNLTVNMGVRWEGTWHPDVFIDPMDTFYAPYLDDPAFPSDGTIPDDLNNFQPRFGLAWDVKDDGDMVVRANAGSYFSRIPMLVFAQHRTTNGAFQQTLFRNSENLPILGPPPEIGELIDGSTATPFLPEVQVASRDMQLPRTWSFSGGVEKLLSQSIAASITYQHARTDNLFRFLNGNDPGLGTPFGAGTLPGGNGLGNIYVTESDARSRYNAVTLGLKGQGALDGRMTFEANYTLAYDKSDDDNERDPFTLRYADINNLEAEYGWSDRDRRHQFNGYALFRLPWEVYFNNIVRFASASPVSESCGPTAANPFAPPAGERAAAPADRVCDDGSVIQRNTLRRENDYFTWDLRISKEFRFGSGQVLEPVFEVFNVTNADNFLDTAQGSLLFNFDGTIRSGLGDTRRAQLGVRLRF
ncbi:MAG: TonB-dependent receptor [Gemmatimonadota bacterium]|nr:TonB-dependent receptor [Gemmatimonadota bacterium]